MFALRQHDPQTDERRYHSRVDLRVDGRLMLGDGREFDCQTIDMSLGGVMLKTPAKAGLGERIVAYVEHLGRIEGKVIRVTAAGFVISLALPRVKRERVAELLMWHANRAVIGASEDRRHARISPRTNTTVIELLNRSTMPARIIDISLSGASIAVEKSPPIGARVVIGRTTGKVVRHFDDGFGIEFLRLIPIEHFDENLIL